MLAKGRKSAQARHKNISKGDNITARAHERRLIINATDTVIGKTLTCLGNQRRAFAKG